MTELERIREEVAKVCHNDISRLGESWETRGYDVKDFYLRIASKILDIINGYYLEKVKGMEREIKFTWRNNQEYKDGVREGVEAMRQAVIRLMEGKE